jgi:3-mercaptopyruvate sulfurtransferase SseA
VALDLMARGFRDVRVLEGGWAAWLALRAPVQLPQPELAR